MVAIPIALALGEALGLVVFGMGIVLITLGITIIIIQEVLKKLLRLPQDRMRGKGEPWGFMQKLIEEMFAVIKDLPVPLRVAFLLIVLGIILLVIGYCMAVGFWLPT
ncbi:MAG: hypothetical protein JTT11_10070 [Candidatus Brockarchaeota archaeon]|nr:hypothetical protein [Candidatus Brockarchaeota archaeon]